MTRNERDLLNKCIRYRRVLARLLKRLDVAPDHSEAASAAWAILGEDDGREGRCLGEKASKCG